MNKNNSKLMWKTLKQLINPLCKEFQFKTINFSPNTVAIGEPEIAENFNSYFVDSISEVINTIPLTLNWSSEDLPLINSGFTRFTSLSMADLRSIIASLGNKGSSEDLLNSKTIKNIFGTVGHVFLKLINTSLETGEFPSSLKTTTVIPLPKVSNSNDASSFRPIHTLPALEKVLELAVYNQLYEYFTTNNILFINQSGFRKKHSCESAIQLTIATWNKLIDSNNYIVAAFLDFRRAFETIDHNILICKLKYYGVGGVVLHWFMNYLINRNQMTKINSSKSMKIPNNFGVPQGSVLGPLLFVVYLNDINHFIDSEFISLFADDTLISTSDKLLNVAICKLNLQLRKIESYLNINRLKLNVNKTKAMILTTKYRFSQINLKNVNIFINNQKLEVLSEIKYLGFFIDSCLTYKSHFSYIYRKIATKLFFFSRVSNNLSFHSKLTVYQSIIQPHFTYCASLLYFLDNNSKSALQKLQNRSMRIILKCNRYTPIALMQDCLNWRPLDLHFKYFTMIFIFKIINNLLPTYLHNYIKYSYEIHDYQTRSRNDFYIVRTNYKKTMNSLFFKGLNDFNNLPIHVKECTSLRVFKNNLNNFMKNGS